MYALSTIKFIQQPVISQQECDKIIQQHALYATYYEDRLPDNLLNTQTVVNMPLLDYYKTAFEYTTIDQLSVVYPHTADEFLFVKSEVVAYKSNSTLPISNTDSTESNVCLIICLKQQLPMPINIVMGLGNRLNTQTLSFNFLPGEAIVYPCDKYSIYIDKLEEVVSPEAADLSNVYVKFYYKIAGTVESAAPTITETPVAITTVDSTPPVINPQDIFYNQEGEPYLFGQPYQPFIP
jgi:hypothetical protein